MELLNSRTCFFLWSKDSCRAILVSGKYRFVDFMSTLHFGHRAPFSCTYKSISDTSKECLQSARVKNVALGSSSLPKNGRKLSSKALQILHRSGHISWHIPWQSWPHLTFFFVHGISHGSRSHRSKHDMLHDTCGQLHVHCSLQRVMFVPHRLSFTISCSQEASAGKRHGGHSRPHFSRHL